MEHQSSNLNTLPTLLILRLRVHERRMRHPPRSPVELAIIALDQHHLLRCLTIQVIPFMLLIRSHSQRLTLAIRVDESDRHKIRFRD